MDLLFKRYANPFLFLETCMDSNCLESAIDEIWGFIQEDLNWDFFLHKVFDKSYQEFEDEINPKKQVIKKDDVEATVIKSQSILDGFIPEERSK